MRRRQWRRTDRRQVTKLLVDRLELRHSTSHRKGQAMQFASHDALRAAVNYVRDSAESGRMSSGNVFPSHAVALHRQAADEPDAMRVNRSLASNDWSGEGRDVQLHFALSKDEAWNLAQFLKRIAFADFRGNAQDDDEAYATRDAAARARLALEQAGYAPR